MKRSEHLTIPELPTPVTLPTGKSRKGLVIAVALIVIVLGVVISTYVMAYANISTAVGSCTSTIEDVRVTDITLLPPSVDMEIDLTLRNPSDTNLHLNRLKAVIFILYGGTTYTLGNIDVSDKSLPIHGYASFTASIHAGENAVDFLSAHTRYDIVVSGSMSITGTWLFWTITKESTQSIWEHV